VQWNVLITCTSWSTSPSNAKQIKKKMTNHCSLSVPQPLSSMQEVARMQGSQTRHIMKILGTTYAKHYGLTGIDVDFMEQ